MAGEKRFTRIPPESTGDRVYMVHTAEIEFSNGGEDAGSTYGPHTWEIGERYTVAGFGLVHVHGVYDRKNGTGILAVHYNKTAKFENTVPAADALISIDGVTVGQVVTAYDVYVPTQNIMGFDNPEYGLDIDVLGSANVRFAEGQPQLDAWGKLRTSGATLLGDYVFSAKEVLDNNFSKVADQAGASGVYGSETSSVTYSETGRYVDVKVKNPSDIATATAKTYHSYVAGSSHLFMGTCLFSGAGTVNAPVGNGASRRFGVFDSKNGFMFHVGPDGVLYLERRNSNSGSKVDTFLACSDATTATALGIETFNKDLVNGAKGGLNPSGMLLDLAKNNQYWIDHQWHGAGRVRFGTFHNGERVVMHEYYHDNRNVLPMNQTISLPCCTAVYGYQQAELNANPYWSALTPIPTAINDTEVFVREFSQAVWTETDINIKQLGSQKTYSTGHQAVDGSDFQYLFSMGIQPLADNGTDTNHSIVIPTKVTNISYDANIDGTGTNADRGLNREAIVHWRASLNTVHHNHVWSNIPGTNMRVSTAGINYESLVGSDATRLFEDMSIGRSEKLLADTIAGLQNGTWKQASDDGGTIGEPLTTITPSTVVNTTALADAGNSQTVKVASTAGFLLGGSITGTNIPAGSHVHAITDATTVEIRPFSTSGSFSGGEAITVTNPVGITLTADRHTLPEPYTKTFGPNPAGGQYKARNNDGTTKSDGFEGMTLSTNDVYLFITGRNTGVLYADSTWTTPVTSTGTYTGTDAELYGYVGPDYIVSFYAHEQIPAYQDPRAMFVIEWKEIKQQ